MNRTGALERARKAASRSAKVGVGVVSANAYTARTRRTSRVRDGVGGTVTRVMALTLLVASTVSLVWKLISLRRPRDNAAKA
jgi:hypothetical protein